MKAKNNKIWDLYEVDLENTRIYNIFTKAWNYRWGKIYSEDKFFTILSWKVELTQRIWKSDEKTTHSTWEIVNIPSWIANIFYFPEDTEMLEWFPQDVKTERFEEYYELKKQWKKSHSFSDTEYLK